MALGLVPFVAVGLLACEPAQVLGSQIAAGQDGGQSISRQIVNPDRGQTRGP
jgi:hypothetical protein